MVHTGPRFLLPKQHAREQQADYIDTIENLSKCILKGTQFTVTLCFISGLLQQKGNAAAELYQSCTGVKSEITLVSM